MPEENPTVTGRFHSQRASGHQWFSWWRHQMETFSSLVAICAGNSPVTGEFPAQRPVTRSFDVFFGLHLNKRSSEAGDLRRFRAHYDVTVLSQRGPAMQKAFP